MPKAAASDTLVAPPSVELPSAVLPAAVVAPPLASPPGVVPPLTSSPSTVRSKKATPPKPKAQRVPKAKAAVSTAPVEPVTPPPSVSPVSGLANGGPTAPSLVPPVSGLASGGSGGEVPFYRLNAQERSELLGATCSKDIPVKLRNKLYAAMNRYLTSSKVTKEYVEKFAAADSKGPHGKFEFLQDWARDTSGGSIIVVETHSSTTQEEEGLQYTWVTKWDLYKDKEAFKYPEMRIYCDKLMNVAKTRKHTDPNSATTLT